MKKTPKNKKPVIPFSVHPARKPDEWCPICAKFTNHADGFCRPQVKSSHVDHYQPKTNYCAAFFLALLFVVAACFYFFFKPH